VTALLVWGQPHDATQPSLTPFRHAVQNARRRLHADRAAIPRRWDAWADVAGPEKSVASRTASGGLVRCIRHRPRWIIFL
jgi:hypothetical protein